MKKILKLNSMKLRIVLAILAIIIALLLRVLNEIHAFNLVNVEFRNVVSDKDTIKLEAAIINESPYTYHGLILKFKISCTNMSDFSVNKTIKFENVFFYSTRKFSIVFTKLPCVNVNVKYSIEARLAYGLFKYAKIGSVNINVSLTRRETMFIVDPLPSKAKRSSIVYIAGKLIAKDTGEPVPHAKILVYDYDDGVWDDLLAYGYTDSSGYFRIPWVAKKVDFPDADAEIYLVFEGNIEYLPSRWPSEGYHKIFVYEPIYPPPG
ncbi:MAG: hypothetical protein J7J78_04270 [Thermoprotei archaeon]|nr:hypothetical protein [Thermoprotei archaeon]